MLLSATKDLVMESGSATESVVADLFCHTYASFDAGHIASQVLSEEVGALNARISQL